MRKNSQKGTTLIESLLAILIMTIVALGGAAFIFFSTVRVNLERNKRVALEMANTRLEEMRAAGFSAMEPTVFGYTKDWQPHLIQKLSGGAWAANTSGVDETLDINGSPYPITTTVQYVDDPDISGPGYDYLLVVVSVGYKLNSNETVVLTTYIQSLG